MVALAGYKVNNVWASGGPSLLDFLQVTIMAHARDVDIKRGINEQFKEIYPHINITLSKIRRFEHVFVTFMQWLKSYSIKREMTKIAIAVSLSIDNVVYCLIVKNLLGWS